jgi:hypothetical protein
MQPSRRVHKGVERRWEKDATSEMEPGRAKF